jgi:hypothetical protein
MGMSSTGSNNFFLSLALLFATATLLLEDSLISMLRKKDNNLHTPALYTHDDTDIAPQLSVTLDVAHNTIIPLWAHNFMLHVIVDTEKASLDTAFESQKKAQFGEDMFAFNNFFFRVTNGLILESGALDGATVSTTHPFVSALGWHAVHIEPQPLSFARLEENRPDGLNIHAALCDLPTPLHYATHYPWPEVGGIWEFMSEQHRSRFFSSMKDADIQSLPLISCSLLTPLLAFFNISHVNFWVLDTEGSELRILQTIDFSKLLIDVIAIEITGGADNEHGIAIRKLLKEKGFCYFGYDPQDSEKMNIWFVHQLFIPHSRPGTKILPISCPGDVKTKL